MATYFWLLVLTLIGPLSRSFESRIAYYKNFRALALSILICAPFFIVKDAYFAYRGVWGFNAEHLLGPMLFNLPIEEILFFVVVPYSCIFIYETIRLHLRRPVFTNFNFFVYLAATFFVIGVANSSRMYTATYSFVAAALLLALWTKRKNPRFWFLDKMILSYLVGLIPFILINGVLTGVLHSTPVVWYNNSENLGIRLGTIPIEDSIYFLCMQLSYVSVYELLLNRRP